MIRLFKALVGAAAGLALLGGAAFAQGNNPVQTTYAYGPNGMAVTPLYSGLTGSYSKTMTSGVIAAGASAGAPIYSFRYTGSGLAVVKKVIVSAGDAGTGFAAGVSSFGVYAARAFTASDSAGTAGTLTGNNAKLRTSFATTGVGSIQIANTGALTAGTRTLDTDPLGGATWGTLVTAGAQIAPPTDLLSAKNAGDYPAVFANNEGFVIQATVPATGTWTVSVYVEWDEYSAF